MDLDGNRIQKSCSPRHWGHSSMYWVPAVSGTTSTVCVCVCCLQYTGMYYTCLLHCRKSASCTHISALLHALVALTPQEIGQHAIDDNATDEALPVTSFICKWNAPRKRKDSNLPISEAVFQKDNYVWTATKAQYNFINRF